MSAEPAAIALAIGLCPPRVAAGLLVMPLAASRRSQDVALTGCWCSGRWKLTEAVTAWGLGQGRLGQHPIVGHPSTHRGHGIGFAPRACLALAVSPSLRHGRQRVADAVLPWTLMSAETGDLRLPPSGSGRPRAAGIPCRSGPPRAIRALVSQPADRHAPPGTGGILAARQLPARQTHTGLSPCWSGSRLTRTSSVPPSTRVRPGIEPGGAELEIGEPASSRGDGVAFIVFPHSLSGAIRRFASMWPSLGLTHPRARARRPHPSMGTPPSEGPLAGCDKGCPLAPHQAPPTPATGKHHTKTRHGAGWGMSSLRPDRGPISSAPGPVARCRHQPVGWWC